MAAIAAAAAVVVAAIAMGMPPMRGMTPAKTAKARATARHWQMPVKTAPNAMGIAKPIAAAAAVVAAVAVVGMKIKRQRRSTVRLLRKGMPLRR